MMLSVLHLGGAESRHNNFTHGTSKCQQAIHNLITCLFNEEGDIDPVLMSVCIFFKGEWLVKQVGVVKSKVRLFTILNWFTL